MNSTSSHTFFDQETLDAIRKHLRCPELQVRIESGWTAKDPRTRIEIRNALSSLLNEDLTDLSRPPVSRTHSISISHCPNGGGYVLAPRPHALGFDFECELRVTKPVVARVSNREEMSAAPGVAHLWTAKEATYKSFLGTNQPSVISSVFIRDWTTVVIPGSQYPSLNVWKFVGGHELGHHGLGILVRSESFLLSIFNRDSST